MSRGETFFAKFHGREQNENSCSHAILLEEKATATKLTLPTHIYALRDKKFIISVMKKTATFL